MATFHSRVVESELPLARVFLSGLNAKAMTIFVPDSRVAVCSHPPTTRKSQHRCQQVRLMSDYRGELLDGVLQRLTESSSRRGTSWAACMAM
ncbi:hypothetical protein [Streptomyces sp. NPDC059753]|uniref:hypothetical protein n=1 Tax=Streptomyces sp. NPDC059753 TaxID=3346933 RepID=UPI003668C404